MGTIHSCHAAIGYRSPRDRERCESCANVRVISQGGPWPQRECGLYGFWTSTMAVCDKYAPKAANGRASDATAVSTASCDDDVTLVAD